MGRNHRSNRFRGPVNALGLAVFDGVLDRALAGRKRRVFAGLPPVVIEVGPGVGANFRYMAPGTRVIAVEPNPAMHARLRRNATRHGIELELRVGAGERLDLPDASVAMVLSSLVLCTVADPVQVVAEILRVLRPGGRYAFVEHVQAGAGSRLRQIQHVVRRPWAWAFEGCSCERDLAAVLRQAGFAAVDLENWTLRPPLTPVSTLIAGTAVK